MLRRSDRSALGGGDPVAGITEMAVRELGPERIVYGSDAPGRSFASPADFNQQLQGFLVRANHRQHRILRKVQINLGLKKRFVRGICG